MSGCNNNGNGHSLSWAAQSVLNTIPSTTMNIGTNGLTATPMAVNMNMKNPNSKSVKRANGGNKENTSGMANFATPKGKKKAKKDGLTVQISDRSPSGTPRSELSPSLSALSSPSYTCTPLASPAFSGSQAIAQLAEACPKLNISNPSMVNSSTVNLTQPETIQVVIRVRGPAEAIHDEENTISIDSSNKSITIERMKSDGLKPSLPSNDISKTHDVQEDKRSLSFAFDRIFGSETQQDSIWKESVQPLVDSFVQGYNVSILAYGQTSSGKTHTMMGILSPTDNPFRGAIPRAIDHLFSNLALKQAAQPLGDQRVSYAAAISYLEIYCEKVYDLLKDSKDRRPLDVRENEVLGVHLPDLSRKIINNATEAFEWIELGNENRRVAATAHNVVSSRSHAIIELTLEKRVTDLTTNTHISTSARMHLVDLAGSEKYDGRTHAAQSIPLSEMKSINQSLNALSKVIFTLSSQAAAANSPTNGNINGTANPPPSAEKAAHISYRDSKLTRLLRDSLGGTSKTLIIACVSPLPFHVYESMNTLKYASRAKMIRNTVKKNSGQSKDSGKHRFMMTLHEEIERLRDENREEAEKRRLVVGTMASIVKQMLSSYTTDSIPEGDENECTIDSRLSGKETFISQSQPINELCNNPKASNISEQNEIKMMECSSGTIADEKLDERAIIPQTTQNTIGESKPFSNRYRFTTLLPSERLPNRFSVSDAIRKETVLYANALRKPNIVTESNTHSGELSNRFIVQDAECTSPTASRGSDCTVLFSPTTERLIMDFDDQLDSITCLIHQKDMEKNRESFRRMESTMQLEREEKEWKRKTMELEEELQIIKTDKEAVMTQLTQYAEDKQQLGKEIAIIEAKLSENVMQLERVDKEWTSKYFEQAKDLMLIRQNLETQLAKCIEDKEQLRIAKVALETKLSKCIMQLDKEMEEWKCKHAELERDIHHIKADKQDLEIRLSKSTDDNQQLNAELLVRAVQLSQVEKEWAGKYSELEQELQLFKLDKQDLETQLLQHAEDKEQLASANSTLDSKLLQSAMQLERVENEWSARHSDLTIDLQHIKTDKQDLETQLERSNEDIEQLAREKAVIEAKVSESVMQLELVDKEWTCKYSELEQELQLFKLDKQDLETQLSGQVDDIERLSKGNEIMNAKLSESALQLHREKEEWHRKQILLEEALQRQIKLGDINNQDWKHKYLELEQELTLVKVEKQSLETQLAESVEDTKRLAHNRSEIEEKLSQYIILHAEANFHISTLQLTLKDSRSALKIEKTTNYELIKTVETMKELVVAAEHQSNILQARIEENEEKFTVKLSAYENELAKLKENNKEYEMELQTLSQKNVANEGKNQELVLALGDCQDALQKASRQLFTSKLVCNSLESKKNKLLAQIKDVQQDLQNVKGQLVRSKQDNKEHEEQIQILFSKHSVSEGKNRELVSTLANCQDALLNTTKAFHNLQLDHEKLGKSKHEVEAAVQKLQIELQSQQDKFETSNKNHGIERANLRCSVKAFEKLIEESRIELANCRQSLQTTAAERQEAVETTAAQKGQLSSMHAEWVAQNNDLHQLSAEQEALKYHTEGLRSEITELKVRCEAATSEIAILHNNSAETEKIWNSRLVASERACDLLEREKSEISRQIVDMKQTLGSINAEFLGLQSEYEEQNSLYASEIQHYKEKYSIVQQSCDNQQATYFRTIDGFQATIRELRSQLQEESEVWGNFETTAVEVHNDISKIAQELKHMCATNATEKHSLNYDKCMLELLLTMNRRQWKKEKQDLIDAIDTSKIEKRMSIVCMSAEIDRLKRELNQPTNTRRLSSRVSSAFPQIDDSFSFSGTEEEEESEVDTSIAEDDENAQEPPPRTGSTSFRYPTISPLINLLPLSPDLPRLFTDSTHRRRSSRISWTFQNNFSHLNVDDSFSTSSRRSSRYFPNMSSYGRASAAHSSENVEEKVADQVSSWCTVM